MMKKLMMKKLMRKKLMRKKQKSHVNYGLILFKENIKQIDNKIGQKNNILLGVY